MTVIKFLKNKERKTIIALIFSAILFKKFKTLADIYFNVTLANKHLQL